jgi:hypothetical protein
VDEDECDINTIKRVLNKIKKNVTTADYQGDYVAVVIGERPADVWYDRRRSRRVEHKGRLYIAYFKPTEKEMQEKRARKAAYKLEQEAKEKASLQGAGI